MPHPYSKAVVTSCVAALLVVVPWINPFAAPPVSTVQPSLVFAASTAMLLALLAVSPLPRQTLWRLAAYAWVAAALINSLFALMQYFGVVAPFAPWVDEVPAGEIYGNLRQRNLFATLCALGIAVLVWPPYANRIAPLSGLQGRLVRLGLALAMVLLHVGLAISTSRTGTMEMVLLWALVWLWRTPCAYGPERRHPWTLLALGAAAYALASWLLPLVTGNDRSTIGRWITGNEDCGSRLRIWANLWQVALEKPWFGWGWGEVGYAQFMTLVEGPRTCSVVDNAHNLPLHLALTMGFPLAGLILVLTGWIVLRARPWQAREVSQQLAWSLLALIGLHSLVEFPLWHMQFQLVFFMSAWYLYGCRDPGPKTHAWLLTSVPRSRTVRVLVPVLAGMVLWACSVLEDSYSRISLVFLPAKIRPSDYGQGVKLSARDVFLFVHESSFARLSSELNAGNAENSLYAAQSLLHFNVSPIAIEKIIACLIFLGRDQEAKYYEIRYQAEFPEDYSKWLAADRKSNYFEVKTKQ